MIKIENVEVLGWEHAIRGMRNPKNSWQKSDSYACYATGGCHCGEENYINGVCHGVTLGENDHDLMMRLRNAGTDHRKFMRMITVYLDITAPLYWWKEFDTYKVGTVANSCSTMHKIHAKEFTLDDFSHERLDDIWGYEPEVRDMAPTIEFETHTDKITNYVLGPGDVLNLTIKMLNRCRDLYLKTKDKKYWWQMIQLLPSSYNQKRTVQLNYEVLANIYKSRKGHKLDEWRDFCSWIETLPYSELITGQLADKGIIMSECVKETKCTHCMYRVVCMHKSDFLRICEAVDRAKIYEKTENGHHERPISSYDCFGGIDVKCKYYDAELAKRKGEINTCSNHT